MTTYTVFADDFEEHAPYFGLSLEEAFAWVLDCCGYDHVFEQRPQGHALVVWDRRLRAFEPREITTTFVDKSDARTVLMLKAVDGRLQSYRALSDEKFRERLAQVMTAMAQIEDHSRHA